MSSTETADQLLQQLGDKINSELQDDDMRVYEALQYIQSFIARKKKILGQNGTSSAVFLGAKIMTGKVQVERQNVVDQSLAISTGVLLKWFIEEGAGKDNALHLHHEIPSEKDGEYCDTQRLLDLLSPLDKNVAGYIVDTIYNPLHLVLAKTKIKKTSGLAKRALELEVLFASILLQCKKWLSAFKSYARLQDAKQVTTVLSSWASEGYVTEKPHFYARGLLQLLSDNKVTLARDVLAVITEENLVQDNTSEVTPTGLGGVVGGGGPMSASLAVYHVAVILTDLANFPPMQRVDRTKLYGLLLQRYAAIFSQLDTKLFELFIKVGDVVFDHRTETQDNSPNPMAMLQNLLAGGMMPGTAPPGGNRALANGGNPLGGMDIKAMIDMMSRLQQK